MSIENALYRFIRTKVDESQPDAAISGAIVHADVYEQQLKGEKFIRIGDVDDSEPITDGLGRDIELNAVLIIQIIARPKSQSLDDRLEARYISNKMALEIGRLINETPKLGDNGDSICRPVIVIKKQNRWRQVGQVKSPVSFLLIKANSTNK